MRQFGLNQPIPGRAHQPDQLHSMTLSGRTDEVWHVTHAAYIHRWDMRRERIQIGTPLEAPLTSTSEYMKWWIWLSNCTSLRVLLRLTLYLLMYIRPPPLFWMHSESMIALCSNRLVSQHHHHRHWFSRHLKRMTKVTAELVDGEPD
ncbi:hypothetical protein PIB30_097144 [Stylosanthes scabra]|uniref:Uncharacterized protein n=1 Tax=Stylosanthes scabra TaxID=79078 RepID=A0ABU6XYN2_9FABA|nr:hypothetical protein [Stylosanthes scabra]